MKRLLAVLLMLLMVVGTFAACTTPGGEDGTTTGDNGTTTGDSGNKEPTEDGVYNGDLKKDYRDTATYTSLDYLGGTTGLCWSPHTWETSDDSYLLAYLTTPLYDFVLNEDATGYTIIGEAATELPIDVTADYVGQYGIEEGDKAQAWLIKLNPAMTWNDANKTKITAADYVYSMKQLLDPLALNRRADSFYSGDFCVVNAKNYFYDGKPSYSASGSNFDALLAAGTVLYVDMWNAWGLKGCVDASGNECPQYVAMNDTTKYRDAGVAEGEAGDWISAKEIYESSFAPGMAYYSLAGDYMFNKEVLPDCEFEEVGIKAVSEYELLIVVDAPVAEAEFYMPYNLSSSWLVYAPLYEANQKWYDADGNAVAAGAENATTIVNTYCTSLESSISFGPYDLTYYELDKQITMSRNDSWFGYSDGKHYGQYQTDIISVQIIGDHTTALQAFLKGEIDGIGLTSADMDTYATSDRLMYTPESYTTKLSFNTDKEALEKLGNNSVILTIPEFREAFSLMLDREKYCTENTAAGQPGYGLLNYMYCYDPFTGELYRDSEHAMKAIVDLAGLEYGDGKEYADLEEAYDAVTGYDPAKAKELMKTAAQKAIDEKLWDGTSEIILDMRLYQSTEEYVKMFNFFNDALKETCKGSKFEGKISLKMTEDQDYYETMYSGNTAIIFSTWGGAAMSPFTMLYQCYCDASDGSGNQMEYGFDTSKVMVELTVNGQTINASLQAWAHWCNSDAVEAIDSKVGKFADYSYDVRCEVFAQLEYEYLSHYTTLPLYYRNVASLLSRKVEYATTDYLQIVGYGGLRFATYNYDDAQWATVKGTITY